MSETQSILTLRGKIIIGAVVIAIFVLMAIIIKYQYDARVRQQQLENTIIEFKQLADGIVRAQSSYATREDLENKLKAVGADLEVIKQDLKQNNANLEKVMIVVGSTPGATYNGLPSNYVIPNQGSQGSNSTNNPGNNVAANNQINGYTSGDCAGDPNHYLTTTQGLVLNEPINDKDKIPLGTVEFNGSSKTPWSYSIYPRKYYSILSFGTNPEGQTVAHAKMIIEDKDQKKYTISINSANLYETPPESSFYWWNPKLMAGYHLGYTNQEENNFASSVGLQLFIMGYGENKIAPRWSFAGLGIGYNIPTSKPNLLFSPFMYRIFKGGSMIQNVHIGPTVGLDLDGKLYTMAGISLSL